MPTKSSPRREKRKGFTPAQDALNIQMLAPPMPLVAEHRRTIKVPDSLYDELNDLRLRARVSYPALLRALLDSHKMRADATDIA